MPIDAWRFDIFAKYLTSQIRRSEVDNLLDQEHCRFRLTLLYRSIQRGVDHMQQH